MKKIKYAVITLFVFSSLWRGNPVYAQDSLMALLSEEITREMDELSKQKLPPYYIDYRVDEINSTDLSASFGSLVSDNKNFARILTVSVRIGGYDFDNTHEFKGDFAFTNYNKVFSCTLPVENEPDAIKQTLWRATDQAYKNAVSAFAAVQNRKEKEQISNVPADFSRESTNTYFEKPFTNEEISYNKNEWINRLKNYSDITGNDSAIFRCNADFNFVTDRQYFISTEGSRIIQNSSYCQIQYSIAIQHEKGTILPLQKSFTAFFPKDLPSNELILSDLHSLYDDLKKMRSAPLAEPYAGPAILSPEASGVFFHEIFGHRIEGQRLESNDDGQTFKDKLGTIVLPEDFSVYSDPTLSSWKGQDLIGTYHYDQQGIGGQLIQVVKNGILKNFLMSRRPTSEFSHSNGHGRAQPGFAPASRQSNLLVESSNALPFSELRKQLIKECKKQKKSYGYYFKEVIGGLTLTDRYNTNVFNVMPTEVYKIYSDGRPDELVTGVELIGTPLTMFSNILSAGDSQEVFTGFCGAESGQIPVTTIAPAIFVKKIETQKTPEANSRLPILPPPNKVNNN